MLSMIVHPEERDALRRIDTLQELPEGCLRAMSRGIFSIFFRWGAALIRIDAGEITGAWILSPWNVPLRFDEKMPSGFGVASANPVDCAVSVLGQRGPSIKTAEDHLHAALGVLVAEVSKSWFEPTEHNQVRLDVARESLQRWALERHRIGDKNRERVERHKIESPPPQPPKGVQNGKQRDRAGRRTG